MPRRNRGKQSTVYNQLHEYTPVQVSEMRKVYEQDFREELRILSFDLILLLIKEQQDRLMLRADLNRLDDQDTRELCTSLAGSMHKKLIEWGKTRGLC